MMMSFLDDKNILITGGTGSFGKMFTKIVLEEYNPKSIRIFSRGEFLQWGMQKEFQDERLRFFIGDVRDRSRLSRAMNDVDIVIHAAALKQVPACEYNPIEAVRTNIDGASNIVNAAIDNEVKKVVALSTDKAVHPVNLYGATKMTAEKLIVQGNAYSGDRETRFACVRYGNVIGSRGSVIPLFKEQRKTGTITITDERMTRFWITLEQGVHLVTKCIEEMHGGEIFIPKIPSMKITDLAEAIAPECKINYIGIRPGEKLHEILITEDEARHTLEMDDYYVIEPEIKFWKNNQPRIGKQMPEGFRYASNTNEIWLDIENLISIVN
ncbi:UDP-N-acetylglucosamine 4,6-dehydratase (inverting) [Methanocalculus sp.]|uniref:UDP-N-acetylglucosamine 4,6-dehydratase (inverting) n=1 Tax=Methanocalculus sp. TaxID=2004547 RepID=UPI00260F452E|nr:UDP-N-acetylglucosamine 4,6-dehydratase (inverting) [Methanocalculus sp.]MDG6249240.1 UDP-N-acetylglucosamine 4,6-dehydratase (inverting) [Methanocalculus sp.]